MSRFIFVIFGILSFFAFICGCGDDQTDPLAATDNNDDDDDSSGDSDSDGDSDADSDDDDNDDDDNDDNDEEEEEICAETNIEIEVVPVNMMLLQDVSGSMVNDDYGNPAPEPTKWTQAKNAINSMLENFADEINFGIDRFPNDDQCGVTNAALSDTLPDNADNINSILGTIFPVGATPILLSMQNYTDANHAPIFTSADSASYLVVISDGADTCGQSGMAMFDQASPQQLTTVTTNLLTNFDIKTFVIGFGAGAEPTQLNAIAAAGGTEITEYIDAVNEEQLADELANIAAAVVSCVYEFNIEEEENEVDMDEVNVQFDGEDLLYNQDCATETEELTWTWVDEEQTQFEFCEAACDELEEGEVEEITITVGCPPDIVM